MTDDEWITTNAARLGRKTIHSQADWDADLRTIAQHPDRDRFMAAAESIGAPRCGFLLHMVKKFAR